MKRCTSGVSEALGGAATIGEGASGAKVAGEEPQAGVRSPEWSRLGQAVGSEAERATWKSQLHWAEPGVCPGLPPWDPGDSVDVSGGIRTLSSVSRKGCSPVMRP